MNSYSFFLFCKLYELYHDFEDLEYDLQYERLTVEYNRYILSDYNVMTKGEYECMIDYIKSSL